MSISQTGQQVPCQWPALSRVAHLLGRARTGRYCTGKLGLRI